ncbi:unnamed protein product [marine sediment metagenome]|uniref:Uncharacterized protein n=1 Tax=marine sediment metagenome TaxID=412755 RepID=X1M336_9ZZZZ
MIRAEIKRKVKKIVKEYCPCERTQQRRKNETKAIKLIEKCLGRLTKEDIATIMEYLDSDLWDGYEYRGRFGQLLTGQNWNLILQNDAHKLNSLFSEIYREEKLEMVKSLISDLLGIYHGFVSCLLYLKDSDKYNVFIPATTKGVKEAFPHKAKVLRYTGPFQKNFLMFNELTNKLKRECRLKPQEVDIVLTCLPSW